MRIQPDDDLLLIIDVQNDFCPGGALAVADGDGVVPVINRLVERFDHVALTQDWHPAGHSSFATSHSGSAAFEAIDMLRKVDPGKYAAENGAQYPTSRLGQSLQQIGQLLKANLGVEVLFVDCGGWDNHVNEGGVQGQLSNLLKDLGQGLAAFHQDMGDRMQDIVVLTMSEFGRTAKENGNRGTDHGHANCMFVMGGDVKGGRVYGKWPGLEDHQLNEGRDLALTTDFRSVVSEVLAKHIGVTELKAVFPGFDNNPRRFLGLLQG